MPTLDERRARLAQRLEAVGQTHLLRFWERLDDAERAGLLDDLDRIDLEALPPLIQSLVLRSPKPVAPACIQPPSVLPAHPTQAQAAIYKRARQIGAEHIGAGRVAAFTVAGGQGTRLGFQGPKGAFRISPIRKAPLFQLFAESLLGTQRRFGRRPPWYIMTSPANHEQTVALFQDNAHFGLDQSEIMFFQQGQIPAFSRDGKILLSSPGRVSLSPDGHGGSLRALANSGALEDMHERDVTCISCFQVDNPLVRTIDPLFVGLHALYEAEISSKAVRKAHDLERVGNFAIADGELTVIEYTDLPAELAREKNADGSRKYDAGSVAIHLLNVDFVRRLTEESASFRLPWHRAEKKVPTIDDAGVPLEPDAPNAVKVEMFVFDAIPLAEKSIVLYCDRDEEFSPVKNAEGVDSVHTSRRDQVRRAARWLERCGCQVPRDDQGEPDALLEISPAFALCAEDLAEQLPEPPQIEPGGSLLLE